MTELPILHTITKSGPVLRRWEAEVRDPDKNLIHKSRSPYLFLAQLRAGYAGNKEAKRRGWKLVKCDARAIPGGVIMTTTRAAS